MWSFCEYFLHYSLEERENSLIPGIKTREFPKEGIPRDVCGRRNFVRRRLIYSAQEGG